MRNKVLGTDTPKISVIVPIYNQDKYIERSLQSIAAQTFGDFEVILVDDGSNDLSSAICEKVCNYDLRFKYLYKKNGGVASARQFGMENSRGEYIIHVDPDDWVERDYLEQLYRTAVKTSADIVICDYIEEFPDGKNIISHKQFNGLSINELKLFLADGSLWGICWNKLVKKSIISDNVYFEPKIDFQEDKLFTYRLLNNAKIVAFMAKGLYHYNRSNPNSAVATYSYKRVLQSWSVRNRILTIESDIRLKKLLAKRLISLHAVNGLFYLQEVGIKDYSRVIRPFKFAIRLLCFSSNGYGLKARILAFMSTFYPLAYLYSVTYKYRRIQRNKVD